jgi:hypothetical protein
MQEEGPVDQPGPDYLDLAKKLGRKDSSPQITKNL